MSDVKKNVGRKPKEKTDTYNSLFASRLRSLLESSETKQISLAEQLNTTRQSVGNWTLGKSQPDFDTLVKIADLFNTSTDFLLGRTDVRTNNQEIRSICDYTGLSDKTVKNFHSLIHTDCYVIQTEIFWDYIELVTNDYCNNDDFSLMDILLSQYKCLEEIQGLQDEYLSNDNNDEKELILEKIKIQEHDMRFMNYELSQKIVEMANNLFQAEIEEYQRKKQLILESQKDGEK